VRITALAIFGSATSTSLTSRARSTTTDLPTPSGIKFEPNSDATTFTPPAAGSRGAAAPSGAAASANGAINSAAARSVRLAIACPCPIS
jgi:hypothetical protein